MDTSIIYCNCIFRGLFISILICYHLNILVEILNQFDENDVIIDAKVFGKMFDVFLT